MNLKSTIFIILTATLFGCKKQSKPFVPKPVYFLRQVITQFQYHAHNDTVQYNYDAKNRLSDYGIIYYGKYNPSFSYSYDADGRVSQSLEYNIQQDTVILKYVYTYNKNSFDLDTYSPSGSMSHSTYSLNSLNQVTRVDTENYYVLYNYDDRGNVVYEKYFPQPGKAPVAVGGSMTYDTHNSAYTALRSNLAFKYQILPHINTCVNNPTLSTGGTYQYDNNGYPTTSFEPNYAGLGQVTTYYNYIVK